MSFLTELLKNTNQTNTLNNAVSNASTLNPVLDFFAMGASMRERLDDALILFKKAYECNPEMALKCLFFMRDVRGGQGEREIFRKCLNSLPREVLIKNLEYIPLVGRYDDLLSLDINLIISFIGKQLEEDEINMANAKKTSLLAKWLPSENTSSKLTSKKALEISKALNIQPSKYRKRISALRKYIRLLEQQMSSKDWSSIEYDKLPSQAFRKHIKAFKNHDKERFDKYLEAVKNGEKKINTSTVFTYEVFDLINQGHPEAADVVWRNLPDYTQGVNGLVIADVSGSMSGRPLSVSISLALYFAERNIGPFKDYFMTFSDNPRLVKVQGSTLESKFNLIESSDWEMSTNIEAAFSAILKSAQNNKASNEEMPKILYIISDMEFNEAIQNPDTTNFENAKKMFSDAGYQLPHVVFWNVNSLSNQLPATLYDKNVTLISGSSQSSFRYAVEGKDPIDLMEEILGSERYSVIKV